MDKLLRTLIENGEISLVGIDNTGMVRHAQIIHGMTAAAATVFGKVITVMTYMSGWLKDENSQISVNFKHHGETGEVCVSGDSAMHMRGYVYNPGAESAAIGKGYMTVVRDDNYKRPFVGTCEMISEEVDENFEYYYRLSEQLPTYLKTQVSFDEHGLVKSAGGVFLQPMPGASEINKQYAQTMKAELANLGAMQEEKGVEGILKDLFGAKEIEEREIEYRCNCSREYIAGVLRGMGKDELKDIVRSEGKINVHCHYCNSDYDFFDADVDALFETQENTDK
ncbi:MAG: Hsp33 family molecular chaperone HslO [Clostridia bacterium]|nr:Hsp33 family molecular chaperone HslO [Clostridia bacterium]